MLKIYQASFIAISCLFFINASQAQLNTDTIPASKAHLSDSLQTSVTTPDTIPPALDTSKGIVMTTPLQVDTTPTSVDVDLEQIFDAKTPKEYNIGDIKCWYRKV